MSQIGMKTKFGEELLAKLQNIDTTAKQDANKAQRPESSNSGMSFLDHLKEGVKEVNAMQKSADSMSVDVATGKSSNLHETMLAMTQAELTFNLMVQVRNRALEAYQEVMRMQV